MLLFWQESCSIKSDVSNCWHSTWSAHWACLAQVDLLNMLKRLYHKNMPLHNLRGLHTGHAKHRWPFKHVKETVSHAYSAAYTPRGLQSWHAQHRWPFNHEKDAMSQDSILLFLVYGNNAMLLRKNAWKHELLKENLANYTARHEKPRVRTLRYKYVRAELFST